MVARRGQYCTFFGFVLAKKVRTDPRARRHRPITNFVPFVSRNWTAFVQLVLISNDNLLIRGDVGNLAYHMHKQHEIA